MPGDRSASATTFSTVVRDGPWMCSAEMQASIRRCRCRAREARSGATLPSAGGGCFIAALELLVVFFWRDTWVTGQKPYMEYSLQRKMAQLQPSGAHNENAGASGPLAHHPAA